MINELEDEEGISTTKQEEMEEMAVSYFSNLFQDHPTEDLDNLFANAEIPMITAEQARELERPFTAMEVTKAIKDMHPSKAPGPDGFHATFY